MSMKTLLPSQVAAIVGVIDPDLNTAGTVTTGWIAAADFASFMAIVMAGALGSGATLDAKIEQATDAAGAGVKDLDGAAITQLSQADGDNDKQAVIELFQEDLDIANDYTHFRVSMTIASASSDSAVVVLAMPPRYGPASGSNLSTVDEIVAA